MPTPPPRSGTRSPARTSRPSSSAPLTSLAVDAAPLRPAPAAPGAAPGSAAVAGRGAGAAAAPRHPARRAAPRKGGRRSRPGALGRGEAPRGAAGGGLRRRRAGGVRRGTSGREAGGDLPRPASSGQRPEHQRHHEAGECHGASPAGSRPSPLLIAPGMRRGKAGPRRPANPPCRAPPATSSRLPCARGKGERGGRCGVCRYLPLPSRTPLGPARHPPRAPRWLQPGPEPAFSSAVSPGRRSSSAIPVSPPSSAFIAARRPAAFSPRKLLPRAWDSSPATFFRGRAPAAGAPPDLSDALTKGRGSAGTAGPGGGSESAKPARLGAEGRGEPLRGLRETKGLETNAAKRDVWESLVLSQFRVL